MNYRLNIFSIFAFVAVLPLISTAQADNWYMSAHGGAVFVEDISIRDTTGTITQVGLELGSDVGYGVVGAVGYIWRHPNLIADLRVEGEASYRISELNKATIAGFGAVQIEGDLRVAAVMVNAYYDFRAGLLWTPYIGIGIGGARVETKDFDEHDNVVSYQGIAGLGYLFSEDLKIELEYRYFAAPNVSDIGAGTEISGDYFSHNIFLGFRFGF